MVDKHCCAEAVDDLAFGSAAEEIGDEAVLISLIGFVFGEAGAVVLADADAFFEGARGVAACCVDR